MSRPENAPEAKTSKGYWNEKVKVKLFKDSKDYKDDVFVAVNGRSYQIRRGVEVEVPRFVAEVLNQSQAQDMETANFIDAKEAEYRANAQDKGVEQ